MRLTDRKRDEIINKIEATRRDLLGAQSLVSSLYAKLLWLDGEFHIIQQLAKQIEANQTQEPE